MTLCRLSVGALALVLSTCAAAQQGGHVLPPVPKSEHAGHSGPVVVAVRQPGFPAEVVVANGSATDLMQYVQVTSRTRAEIVSAKLGWAYVLPGGLEFHEGETIAPKGGVGTGGSFDVGPQSVAPRPDAKDVVAFVEEVTFLDKTVYTEDHERIKAFYSACCTPDGKAKAAADKDADAKLQALKEATPGGLAGKGPARAEGLKPIAFDVVSFRRTLQPGSPKVDLPADGDFIAYHGSPVDRLILFAYGGMKKGYFNVTGEPPWVMSDLYDFQAKVAHEDLDTWKAMTLTDKRFMMQTLLADVLKLQVHSDTEPHPVYDLVVAKGGPKLTEYQPGDSMKMPWGETRTGKVLTWVDPFHLVCQDETMGDLANSLSGANRAGKVVIDKTGLTGVYNFAVPIPYAPLPAQLQQMGDDAGVPSVFDGLKQLGLQLVSAKEPISGIVIDHIEKPVENSQ